MKKLYLVLIIIIMVGCADSSEDESTTTAETEYSLSGSVQDAFCQQGGIVRVYTLNNDVDLSQTGFSYQTQIINDLGEFEISSRITNRFVEVFADVICMNEVTGLMMSEKTLSGIMDLTEGHTGTISPLTTIRSPRLRELYDGTNFTVVRSQTELEIVSFFGMPEITTSFSDASILGDSTGDQFLLAGNSMLLSGKTVPEQVIFMTQLSQAMLDGAVGTDALKAELKTAEMGLPLATIKDNLNAKLTELGYPEQEFTKFMYIVDSDGDGIINANDPDSYIDLLVRDPVIQGNFNLDKVCSQSFGDDAAHYFALPYRFDSTIEGAKYFGISWDADYMSIYSVDNNGTDTTSDDKPGVALLTVSKIPDNFFNRPLLDTDRTEWASLPGNFHADISGVNIPYDQNVFIVMWKDADYNPQIGCRSDNVDITFTAFSKNHFSDDGVNWFPTGNASIYTTAPWRAFWTD